MGNVRRWVLAGAAGLAVAGLAGCGNGGARASAKQAPPVLVPAPVHAPVSLEIPKGEKPFETEVGLASWYGRSGRKAANGEEYDQDALTAASRTLPLGALARVTNLVTGQAAVVRITDRGPFVQGRIMDLSLGAAKATGLYRMGLAKVKIEAFTTPNVVVGEGHWCVQIGAFGDPGNAAELKSDLLKKYGSSAKVISFKGDTGSWVRLTPVSLEKGQADEMAARLRVPEAGVVAYVTRTN